MTREEILNKHIPKYKNNFLFAENSVLHAMQEYAEQEVNKTIIDYTDWIKKNYHPHKMFTSKQLIDLYLKTNR